MPYTKYFAVQDTIDRMLPTIGTISQGTINSLLDDGDAWDKDVQAELDNTP